MFISGCAIGLDNQRGILIGGHHVFVRTSALTEESGGHIIPTNTINNDQVLEFDITTDSSNWNKSSVPLKEVITYVRMYYAMTYFMFMDF